MRKRISAEHLEQLRPVEDALKEAVLRQDSAAATTAMQTIQTILSPYGPKHYRILECRLWYFESVFDANDIATAESGFSGIAQRASPESALFIEASFFLALCLLRQKRIPEAKARLRLVFERLNTITSAETRQLRQKRFVERIEQEAVLTALIGTDAGVLRPDQIHQEAIKLVQMPEGELFDFLARALPYGTINLLSDVRTDTLLLLPPADRKLLPPPGHASQAPHVGKLVMAVLKRIGWKTFCDEESPLYKLWSKKITTVFSPAYFATWITATFVNWKIGVAPLAAGVVAIAMRYGAEEFCRITKPNSIMEARGPKGRKKNK